MSDITESDKSSSQNVIRQKFQPIRLKALLQFCESDDDNDDNDGNIIVDDNNSDDDDNDESKYKPSKIEDNLDIDELSLLQDNSAEDTKHHQTDIDSSKIKTVDGFSRTCVPLEKNDQIVTIYTTQEKINCAKINDKKECNEIDNVNSNSFVSIGKTNKLETHTCKFKEKSIELYDNTTVASKNYQTNVLHERSTDIILPPLSAYKKDYNVKPDVNENSQRMSTSHLHYETAHSLDTLNKKKVYDVSVETKKILEKYNETRLSNANEEYQRQKGIEDFVEQTNKECEEEYRHKSANFGSESVSSMLNVCRNSMPFVPKYSTSLHSFAKNEENNRYAVAESSHCVEFNTPLLSNITKSPAINSLVTETPLKSVQVEPVYPHLSLSHYACRKQPNCTPRNKLADDSSKSYVQTPSVISSSESRSNIKYTPMNEKSFCGKTPRKLPVYAPTIKEFSRYSGVDVKNTRRPLADAVSIHNDSSIHLAESKQFLSQTHPEAKCIRSDMRQENGSRKAICLSELELMQTETNRTDNSKSASSVIEETKENKEPNISHDTKSGRKITYDEKENKQAVIRGSNTSLKLMEDSVQKYKDENNVPNVDYKNLHDHYSIHDKQREEVQRVVDKATSIQFIAPSSINSEPRQQSKTLLVKNKEYVILGSLGRGMSGEVLRVQDVSCGELRAIKCVDLSKMDKESAQGCFDEISLLHKLQAPCVVRMFDYHIKDYMLYVVMEMGDTDFSRLLKSISQEKQLPLTTILYYWTEMLTAVKHIHDNGVIHSDLKPANFLLVRGRLKLIDFGIASNINSDMTSVFKNNPIGTLNYISPEALMGIGGNADSPTRNTNIKYKISFKSDVWSLGCILYSLVYGHTPFHHIRSQWAKINAITNPTPNISFSTTFSTSDESQNSERVPLVLIDVMRKCLQHDPKARPTVFQLLQVQYVPTKQDVTPIIVSDIPVTILAKIKHALNEEEWRQLVHTLDTKRRFT